MMNHDIRQQKKHVAEEIMNLTRNELIVMMPFFNRAIMKMDLIIYDKFEIEEGKPLLGFGTDGNWLYCQMDVVNDCFRNEPKALPRALMHMVFHCMFHHPFQYQEMNMQYWDVASDIAVEHAILGMKREELAAANDTKRRVFIDELEKRIGRMTAENIYHYMKKDETIAQDVLAVSDLFFRDLHPFWLPMEDHMSRKPFMQEPHPGMGKISDEWKELGISVNLDVQVFEKNQGLKPGVMLQHFTQARKEKYDYSEFLKKFAVMNEEVHINHEEFDYIYYTYGIDLYGNMPLIEPLEYREVNRIRDFVIAIDTSGSCQGKVVENFLRKTYNILKTSQSFFDEVNIHIIQCDSEIQKDVCIHSEWEFDEYIQNMKIYGFGGTDFRPVFHMVDQMIKNREFTDLKGLIYFTDGRGVFPERMPEYKTAFVFVDDGFDLPKFPSWAIRLILTEEEFEEDEVKV